MKLSKDFVKILNVSFRGFRNNLSSQRIQAVVIVKFYLISETFIQGSPLGHYQDLLQIDLF